MSRFLLSMALLVFLAVPAQAAFFITNPSGFSGSESLITFAGASGPLSSMGGVTFDLDFENDGAFDDGGAGVWADGSAREFGPSENTAINNFPAGAPGYPNMRMTFASAIDRLAFEMRTNTTDDIDITVSLMSSGDTVDSFTFSTQGASQYFFYGFQTTALFDQVDLDVQDNINGAWAMDNLRFEDSGTSSIPEPSTAILLGVAVGGFALIRRRKCSN